MKGFQAIIRTTKRGKVTHVEYLGPTGSQVRVVYTKRLDSWEVYDSTGRQGFFHASHIAAMFKAIEQRIAEREALRC